MKILIVEDVEDSRVYLRQALESAGYEIIESSNGAEALMAAQQTPPDMIVSDIMMPEMDGFELCLRVKNDERLKHIPFIFYTATYLDTEDEELGLHLGASQYLTKPMDHEAFLSVIKQSFDGLKTGEQAIAQKFSSEGHQLLARYFKTLNKKLTKRNRELIDKQEALERISREYVELFENAPDMYASVSAAEAKILLCNKALLRKTGYSRDEVVGASIFKLYHDDCLDEAKETFKNFDETGFLRDQELILKKKDGGKIDVSLNVSSVRDESGKIIHSMSSWRDITDRKKADEKLRQSEDNYRLLINNIPDVTWTSDSSGKTMFMSPNIKTVYGYTPDELYKGGEKLWFGRVHPDDLHTLKKSYNNLFEQDMEFDIEYRIRRKDGQWIWLHDRAIMHYEKDKKKYAFGIFSDITERKQVEDRLLRSEEKYRLLVENAYDGIEISQNDKILYSNSRFAEMLGYSVDEITGMSFELIFTSQAREDLNKRLNFKKGKEVVTDSYETTFCRKDGRIIDVEVKYEIIDFEGKPATFAIVRDITEHKLAEREREGALKEARKANKVKDQFIANMSHEIRTPLNSLLGFTDYVKQRYLDLIPEKDHVVFNHISDAGDRLVRTVDSILNISLLKTGTVKIRKRKLDPHLVAKLIVERFQIQAQNKTLDLRIVPPKQAIQIFADEYCIYEAITNLTDNAIKYTNEGSIELTFGQRGAHKTLSITDTGIGISKEYQTRIFEPYTQESEGYTKSYQGIGLGLALTKHYLNLNNIEIELESKQNVGTSFTLIFPKEGE